MCVCVCVCVCVRVCVNVCARTLPIGNDMTLFPPRSSASLFARNPGETSRIETFAEMKSSVLEPHDAAASAR